MSDPKKRFLTAAWILLSALATLAGPPTGTTSTPASAPVNDLGTRLDALLASLPPDTTVGLVIEDLDDGRLVYLKNPDTPLKPASVLKLFTSSAALLRFGPDFEYVTRVYWRDGELWVIGAGDPALGDERLANRYGRDRLWPFDRWAEALTAAGIDSLERIVLDDGVFERTGRHPDWPDDQADRWYQAPVGGLNFNDNCLDARVRLASSGPRLELIPALPPNFIRNDLLRGPRHAPTVRRGLDSDVFEFRGTVAREAAFRPVSVRRPTLFFGHALKTYLQDRGIKVTGPVVRRRIAPADLRSARLVAESRTGLRDVLWRCNTFSQNLFAECLMKSLSAYGPDGRRTGTEGGWTAGAEVLRRTLGELGVDLSGAVFRDGSGLSHQNRVTARQVATLLELLARHPLGRVFADSLAVPGQPGSMRTLYRGEALAQRLRGKTGTIDRVRTLAGYASRPDGTRLVFALLCNGAVKPDFPARVARVLVGAPD